jgi:hypothetical protein
MINRPALKTVEDAAAELNVPKASLRSAAEGLGLLIYMGRAVRIDPNNYEELIQGCQGNPQGRASISEKTLASTSFATPDIQTNQQVQATVAKLKKRSQATSPAKVLSLAPVARIVSK